MTKGLKRLVVVVGTLMIVVVPLSLYYHVGRGFVEKHLEILDQTEHPGRQAVVDHAQDFLGPPYRTPKLYPTIEIASTHHEIFSLSSKDGKYLRLDFGDYQATNPNIIPHPQLEDTWIMVAQQQKSDVQNTVWFAELVCLATFHDDVLRCSKSPLILPIAATSSSHCTGDYEHFSWNVGPHDARVFYGPHNPYIIYGSNSEFACFGQWTQDFRLLVDWGREEGSTQPFARPTDLQRPPPYGVMEKNWFFFWDVAGQLYLHYDMFPRRVLAQVDKDGSVGEDLATASQQPDEACMAKHLPQLPPTQESIHQATNSLSVTLCKRSDASCVPNVDNTFIMAVIQHKQFYALHGVYEPYVVLFRAVAPFQIHAISAKPFWIHGRGTAGEKRPSRVPAYVEWSQTEMFYVTSISWKAHGQKYHGHADDTLLLGFGIEDETSGVIDLPVSDLLDSLAIC